MNKGNKEGKKQKHKNILLRNPDLTFNTVS